ncbi:MAG: alpha/beta fold hydrolase [Desulfobaccales bacterium]
MLVFIHGWGTTGSVWVQQLKALADQRARVLAPTLPTWEVSRLAHFLQNHPLPETVAVGWSLGGMLLVEALSRLAEKPAALVLVATPACFCQRPDYPWGQPAAAVRALRRTIRRDVKRGLLDFAGRCLAPGEADFQGDFTREFQAPSPDADLAAGLDYLLSTDLRPRLAAIRGRCFIVQGEEDRIVPPEQAEVLQRFLPGARLIRFPGAGHAPFFTQADEFNTFMGEVCREVTAS